MDSCVSVSTREREREHGGERVSGAFESDLSVVRCPHVRPFATPVLACGNQKDNVLTAHSNKEHNNSNSHHHNDNNVFELEVGKVVRDGCVQYLYLCVREREFDWECVRVCVGGCV